MEANPRTSLRKGFPIKIGGYAVGGRSSANENNCDIKAVRFRQRRNSDTSFDRSSISRTQRPPEAGCKQLYSPLLGLRRRSVGGVQFVNLGIGNEERDKAEFSVLENCQKPLQKLPDNVTAQREHSASRNVKNEEISAADPEKEHHSGDHPGHEEEHHSEDHLGHVENKIVPDTFPAAENNSQEDWRCQTNIQDSEVLQSMSNSRSCAIWGCSRINYKSLSMHHLKCKFECIIVA